MSVNASEITDNSIVCSISFVQVNMKENIKAPHYRPIAGNVANSIHGNNFNAIWIKIKHGSRKRIWECRLQMFAIILWSPCVDERWDEYTECYNISLLWRHNERDGVSNHQPHDCLLNRLFRRRSKKTSKPRVSGFCAGNSPVIGEFPAQMASNAENVSIFYDVIISSTLHNFDQIKCKWINEHQTPIQTYEDQWRQINNWSWPNVVILLSGNVPL